MDSTPFADDLPDRGPDVTSDLAAMRRDLGELIRSVRLMSQNLEWLMDNVPIIADAPVCDLEGDVDATMANLAATVEHAERFQDQLLDTASRSELTLALDRHAEWARMFDRQQSTVVTLSEAIVGDDEATAVRAGDDFPAAWQALTELEQDGPRLANTAKLARERLDADEEVRREHIKDIDAIGPAWLELTRRLHSLIDSGVAEHALFPAWFRNSLGLTPPPAAPTRWFELAIEILAYRITYRVESDDSPLGDPPPDDASARRRRWYQRLTAGLARLT
jgi:hypothetical protein